MRGKYNTLSIYPSGQFSGEEGPFSKLSREARETQEHLAQALREQSRLLPAPLELEEANAFSVPLGGREGPAGAIVGLTAGKMAFRDKWAASSEAGK